MLRSFQKITNKKYVLIFFICESMVDLVIYFTVTISMDLEILVINRIGIFAVCVNYVMNGMELLQYSISSTDGKK